MLDHRHPLVRESSVIDDRNIRGPAEQVIAAVQEALRFDHMARLDNSLNKFAALDTTEEGRTKLRSAF